MAVLNYVPDTLAGLFPEKDIGVPEAEAWGEANGTWIRTLLKEHDAWLKEAEIPKYQQAYDGYIEAIDEREKNRGDDINNKIFANLFQLIIETCVDYMIGQAPTWKVEDPETEEEGEEERDIIKEYRQEITDHLGTNKAQRVLREQLTQGSIAKYAGVVHWVDEYGNIDFEEFPVQEIIPVYNSKDRLVMVLRRYEVKVPDKSGNNLITKTRVEVYDDKYVTYYISDETGDAFELDSMELDDDGRGNPIEHKAGRIPISIFINGSPATYSKRLEKTGTSDLGNGVYSVLEDLAHKISDKSNLVEYLLDQYLLLKGVDTDEDEVKKMRKARALALKDPESDATFISQDQDDNAVENHIDRLINIAHDMTFTPKIQDLAGKTAYEIKMQYSSLDIKAGKKEIYFMEAVNRTIEIITDFLNARRLIEAGVEDYHAVLTGQRESSIELYDPAWVTASLNRNLPQNYEELANIASMLFGKVPDKYIYEELLWFIDDPKKAVEEMKEQRKKQLEENFESMGLGGDFANLGTDTGEEGGGVENSDE